MTPSPVPNVTLNNGVEIPQVGFGVFQVPEGNTQQAVELALECGYRHIDTAAAYYNEDGVGAAIKASGLPRDELFVATKLRNGDQGYEQALKAFDESRRTLGLGVVDLYLVHWPVPSRDLYVETWKALEKLYADGAVRAIGISNFLPEHIGTLTAASEIVPAVNQIELHPTFQQPATQSASRAANIAVEAYSPLGQGADLDHSVVRTIAEEHGKTPAQVVLRWHIEHGTIVIPKSVTPERIAANIDLFDFELNADEVASIDALDTDERVGADPATAAFTQYR